LRTKQIVDLMRNFSNIRLLFFLFIANIYLPFNLLAIEIDRFEHINTDNGLSQNTVTSLHCDHKGFLWIGTMNGLNRYDGYSFKIYRNRTGQSGSLTHNRIVSIWEDARHFLWVETYDGYYHHFNPQSEIFSTLPKYSVSPEEKFSRINCFLQYTPDEIWLGSSNSGVYLLRYHPQSGTYDEKQFLSRGQYSISNNNISFIIADADSNIWIGASNGLNLLKYDDYKKNNFYYQHFFSGMKFTCASSSGNQVWFGTQSNGIQLYDLKTQSFKTFDLNNSPDSNTPVSVIKATRSGNIVAGSNKLYLIKPGERPGAGISLDGTQLDKLYEDQQGMLWVTTQNFGVHRVDQLTGANRFFDLTPDNYQYLSDRERPYFFEDSNQNLWICVHGGGLVLYNPIKEVFHFYRNDPSEPGSISSNTVMCMTEDHNKNLWVGTSLQGGLNKIIIKNQAFTSIQPNDRYDDFVENIVRAIMQDANRNSWIATKGGDVLVYDQNLKLIKPNVRNPFESKTNPVYNLYAMLHDSKGHIWLGSKGDGIAVSKYPVKGPSTDYSRIEWIHYRHNPSDPSSISDNNIYSLKEDHHGNVWVGTYGGGICCSCLDQYDQLRFRSVNTSNSNLSSNQVRNLFIDSKGNLWVATVFGLNQASLSRILPKTINFKNFIHNPEDKNSLVYNDVVHIQEDSHGALWLGTFGGGINRLTLGKDSTFRFEVFDESMGLSKDEVYGILEDNQGFMWFSTENGLSRFDAKTLSFENFNKSNSLRSNGFSENTCEKMHDGRLLFGHSKGFEVVDPEIIHPRKIQSRVTFTNLQLFNIPVGVNTIGTPLKKSIAYTENLVLKHNQSSFSLEYSALNYLDESKVQYAYILENFDKNWNYVGSDRKATYTNLKPGSYIFKVKAALWNGQWDENETSMQIEILPPWWLSTWAYIVYLTISILLIFFASRIILGIYSYRNQLKIEKAVNEVKLQFFTNISHEIRTPLTLILGPIEDVLSDLTLPEKFRVPLQLMQKNGKRMLHLLNQLLDFRKAQNQKMNLHIAPVEIGAFAKEIFGNFQAYAQHRGIDYRFDNPLPLTNLWIDPNRMDSVVFNILSNAFKNTPKGEIISMTIEDSGDTNEVLLKITDHGKGIQAKDIPLLFERYSILSDLNSSSSGTGIGLHLSNEIVKLHGGRISVEGNKPKGSTFIVGLKRGNDHLKDNPLITIESANAPTPFIPTPLSELMPDLPEINKEGPATGEKEDKPLLLLVEDHLQIISYIESAFEEKYQIVVAYNGKEGLEKASECHPDMIISDVMMPVIDGIEMTRTLKSNFDTCHIPVILLTAKTGIDDQIDGIEAGAEAYVLKPFNMGVLKSMVHNLLQQRKLLLKKFRDKQDVSISDLKFTSRDQEFMDNLVKYIEKNYGNPELTINHLAEFSCVSRTVFYNKVKTLTGISPVEFLRQIKLKIAAKMLENGYNVSEAALNIGFNDTRYFSRQFKELFGESPSQYKKRHTGIDDVNSEE